MRFHLGHQGQRKHESASAGIGLRRPNQVVAAVVFRSLHPDGDGPVEQVDVSPFETQQLTPPETPKGGEKDEGSVLRLHLGGERAHLRQGRQRPFVGGFDAGALDRARVGHDEAVLDGGVEDRAEESIALGHRRRAEPVGEESSMPAADA
ncbi:MAG: hypothetical protein M5T61_18810 [Acidimicrobiia bacterium]|nr:hypothetical protein [Acidimicrobiia bacterium]